jgi:hypothetical protein
MEDDLEKITKEWSMNLLVPVDLAEMYDVESLKNASEITGPTKIKKTKEVHDLYNASVKTTSILEEEGEDGGEIDGTEVGDKKGEVTHPRDEEDPSKKRKVCPSKPSSRKKMKETRTKFESTLTSGDFEFIVTTLNDASLEIEEKQEDNKEEVFN